MAIEIAKDYMELNFASPFRLLQAKEYHNCIILTAKNLKKVDKTEEKKEDDTKPCRFYKIEINVKYDEEDIPWLYTFIVQAIDVDIAMLTINDYIRSLSEKEGKESIKFKTTIESAALIPCTHIVGNEFSSVYINS
ncbi:hypothetical protein EZS27_024568 [termite gut metagenome]|uniref:Uncharacterized protein n=1 Tax=termite gut metagenome TaxID=433724 RepID=A0A5J4QWH0_9ZZZZ